MFKKGFLKPAKEPRGSAAGPAVTPALPKVPVSADAQQSHRGGTSNDISAAVDALAAKLTAIQPLSKPYGGLPVELLIHIITKLIDVQSCPKEQLPRSLSSLRLTSKLLCEVATAHFYKVIKVINPSGVVPLVASLQDQPKLCAATRAIWWDKLQSTSPEKPLVRFPNVDEVAYCHKMRLPGTEASAVVGEHYAMRDKGAWCQSVLPCKPDYVPWLQSTPTLSKLQDLDIPHSRAVWGVHFIIPAAKLVLDRVPRTVTHVALTLTSNPQVETELQATLSAFLDRRRFPLLTSLRITLINFGMPKGGVPTAEDLLLCPMLPTDPIQFAFLEGHVWESRVRELKAAQAVFQDARLSCDTLDEVESGKERSDSRLADVRQHLLMSWRHRIYFRRDGPWRGAPMTWPSDRPQV